ncbi:tetratricopeptide repeat protein [Microtetraspora malaysiensis]|uniref:tetratricopeptide repeat protein n=1 Tax=Microtetraspora malaysiensis TaxID=161358 RepID=UPI00082F3495|nr:tetratricopeptide repeat protein [Microtetraspora malaysiensis]
MDALVVDRHPLATVLARNHWTATGFLRRVAERHRPLGYGSMATRKEKVSRWTAHAMVPEMSAQLAIADLLGIDPEEIYHRGWPHWLLLTFRDDCTILESPWTPAGTVSALEDVGGPVDRRGFLITASGTLAAALSQWAAAPQATTAPGTGRHVGEHVADLFDVRLDALRHLDDQVGSGQAYDAATAELRLITRILKEASYSEATGRRLYASAAEASRLAGWCAYDAGHTAAAERHFVAALRASGSAGDETTGASTLAFWANLRYANGDPRGALDLIDGGLRASPKVRSWRVVAMLHARRARAYSTAGEATASFRAVDDAFTAYERAVPAAEDSPAMYWLTAGELHQVAASSALALGEPRRALDHFDAALAHEDPYDSEKEARGTAIYLARRASAHLALADVDAALEVAYQVVDHMGGVTSARGTSTLADLRAELDAHRQISAVRDFLELTI